MTKPTPHGQVPEAFLKSVIALCSHRGYSPANIEAWDKYDKWIADLWRQAEAMLAASPAPQQSRPLSHPKREFPGSAKGAAITSESGTPPAEQQAASSAVLKAIREANMQLVRTGDDVFMLVPYKVATAEQTAPKTAPGEPPGIQALMCVISSLHSLRDTAHFSDEEGELTNDLCTLRDWAYAQTAAFQPAPTAQATESVQEDAARLDWLEQNLFHREKDEWDTKFGGYKEYNMWVLFSPKGIQGSARNIIDAARKQG